MAASLGGRRLQASLRSFLGLDLDDEAAATAGSSAGILAGLATGLAAGVITTIAVASLPATVGLAGAALVGVGVSFIAQNSLDDLARDTFNFIEDDVTVEQAFEHGQAIGALGTISSAPFAGLPKLLKSWRSSAALLKGANAKVLSQSQRLAYMRAQPAGTYTEQELKAAENSLRAYRGWATRRGNKLRADAAGAVVEGLEGLNDAIDIGGAVGALDKLYSQYQGKCSGRSILHCSQALSGGACGSHASNTLSLSHSISFSCSVRGRVCHLAPHVFHRVVGNEADYTHARCGIRWRGCVGCPGVVLLRPSANAGLALGPATADAFS